MIWAAIIIEAAIQNWIDFGILMFIQFANASIGFYETTKAGDAVAALKKSLKPQATCKRNGEWKIIDGGELVPGDLVLLAAGSAIPADCRVNEGQVEVDQAALTGESLPVTMYQNFSVKMGSTVVRGEQEGTVEHTGPNTFLGKTAALLGGDTEYSNFQVVLMTIVKILVVLSLTLCSIVLIYLSIKADFVEGNITLSLFSSTKIQHYYYHTMLNLCFAMICWCILVLMSVLQYIIEYMIKLQEFIPSSFSFHYKKFPRTSILTSSSHQPVS